jgi:hypothetical protein
VRDDDQQANRGSGESEASTGCGHPSPVPAVSGLAPQLLPGVGPGLRRDRGERIGFLYRCSVGDRAGRGRVSTHPITQGSQLVDRQDLVGIRFIHNQI